MLTNPVYMADPEIVVPSLKSQAELVFWQRMNDAASDLKLRVGPGALVELGKLADTPPDTGLLARADFWTILSKFMARSVEVVGGFDGFCETHTRVSYEEVLGRSGNIDLLVRDLRSAARNARVLLRTVEDCWIASNAECQTCDESRVDYFKAAGNGRDDLGVATQVERDGRLAESLRRSLLEIGSSDMRVVESNSGALFPRLVFSDHAWARVGSLAGSDSENVKAVVHHLGALNDFASRIWAETATTVERQAHLSSLGVEASPESPNTRRNKTAIKKRDFRFGSDERRCEWHTKMRPDANRIHFLVEGDTVYIGTIDDHLPT